MAQEGEQLRGAAQSIHEFFTVAERRFRAPEFQRHYVWRAEGTAAKILRFWDDFENLRAENENGEETTLFLGAIVLQIVDSGGPSGVPLLSIIDGQQRILTLYMILVALADWYQTAGATSEATDIERRYLLNQASNILGTSRVEPTLNDTKQFLSILSCLKNPSPVHHGPGFGPEDHNLARAWRAIHRHVGKLAEDDEGELSEERLNQLRDDLLTRIDVVTITLGNRHDPHEVYERLNIGGEPLKPIDLIRNAVFLTIGSDQDAAARIYREHWDPFETELGLEHHDKYVTPYAAIRDATTTKATQYPKLRDYWRKHRPPGLSGEKFGEWIVDDLREFLPAYRAIAGAAKPTYMEPDSWRQMERLHRIGVPDMTYPYLMQLVQEHLREGVSLEELTAVVDLLDSFFIRRAFAGLRNTGMNPVFRTLWNASKQSIDDLKKRLDTRTVQFPSDEQFADDIRTTAIYSSGRCAYVLHEYERDFAKGDKVNWDVLDPTIDHLMPQRPAPDTWQHISPDDHQRLLHTWANLVPMGDANALKGAKEWHDARELVVEDQASFFRSTVAVFKENERWGVKEIEARAEKLVRWALKRWPKD